MLPAYSRCVDAAAGGGWNAWRRRAGAGGRRGEGTEYR